MAGIIPVMGGVGDNKEFSVAATGLITVTFRSELNSGDDNTTTGQYYFNIDRTVRKFVLRTNQTIEITRLNGLTLTDPITVAIGDGSITPASGIHKEEYDQPILASMQLRILTTNTNLKLRMY